MGAMKRIVGWRQSGGRLTVAIRELCGELEPGQLDREREERRAAREDAKQAAAEAKAERSAIQAEARDAEAPAPMPKPSAAKVEAARIATERFAAEAREMEATVREGIRRAIRAVIDPAARPDISEIEEPGPVPEPDRYIQTTMF